MTFEDNMLPPPPPALSEEKEKSYYNPPKFDEDFYASLLEVNPNYTKELFDMFFKYIAIQGSGIAYASRLLEIEPIFLKYLCGSNEAFKLALLQAFQKVREKQLKYSNSLISSGNIGRLGIEAHTNPLIVEYNEWGIKGKKEDFSAELFYDALVLRPNLEEAAFSIELTFLEIQEALKYPNYRFAYQSVQDNLKIAKIGNTL